MSATRIETTYLKLIFTKLACSTKKVAGTPYECVTETRLESGSWLVSGTVYQRLSAYIGDSVTGNIPDA